MIVELGHLALVFALVLGGLQGVAGLVGAHRDDGVTLSTVRPLVYGHLLFVAISFLALTIAFLSDDFSVLYVASHSNTALPTVYKISAVWGAHEGSLLLWALVQATWSAAVALRSTHLPPGFAGRVLGVLGLVSVGFLLFILFTSNPFERLIPGAAEGRDLNPLLQDPGLAIHPPMLYIGYVGFSVAFAFAVAALLEGRIDSAWTRWCRPWTVVAWSFLTVGIALGSWWAYYELGWGGWWFWDPVENASFMPWLVGTALIHSLAVTEQREAFKAWTLLLAVFAFGLSLLGTFLVRSGVLISVHAFASDPARGAFILAFLVVVLGSALGLYAWRAPQLADQRGFRIHSREGFLLLNNLLLVVTAAAILWGTLYPLFLDAIGSGKVSVGPPWFNLVFVILTLPLAWAVGLGPYVRWKRSDGSEYLGDSLIPLIASLILGAIVPWLLFGTLSVGVFLGAASAAWVTLTALRGPIRRLRMGGERSLAGKLPARILGMTTAHLGVAVFIVGATFASAYSIERDAGLSVGESTEVAGYTFRLEALEQVDGPNYTATEARVLVQQDGETVTVLKPQKRVYRVQRSPMTEAGIHGRIHRDLFVAMGEPLGEGAWSFRLQVKPALRLVWLGALLMALGGLIAATDRRYRRREEVAP